jgi:hypothetical protein
MEHKHAAILRAIADGKDVQARLSGCKTWTNADPVELATCNPLANPFYEWRIKPKTININGHEVPAPMREAPARGDHYFSPNIVGEPVTFVSMWTSHSVDCDRLYKGLCHATQEAAEAHAKALLSFTTKDQS